MNKKEREIFKQKADISRFSQPTKDRDAERANLSTSSLNSELSLLRNSLK